MKHPLIFLLIMCGYHITAAQQRDTLEHVSSHSYPAVIPPAAAYIPQQKPVLQKIVFSSSFINPGFFCRQEVKMDKHLPVPFRFRLGSLQYCNWLEQKPGYTGAPQQ